MGDRKLINPQEHIRYDGQIIFRKTTAQGDVYNDGSVDRVLIGFLKGGFGSKEIGLKVSKDSYDVKTATDDQLVFNSSQNVFKIVTTGTTSLTLPSLTLSSVGMQSSNVNITIAHNLGYVPAALVYSGDVATNFQMLPRVDRGTSSSRANGSADVQYGYQVDSVNITIFANVICELFTAGSVSFSGGTVTSFKFYLLRETAN